MEALKGPDCLTLLVFCGVPVFSSFQTIPPFFLKTPELHLMCICGSLRLLPFPAGWVLSEDTPGLRVLSPAVRGGCGTGVPLPCCSQAFSYALSTGESLPLALALFAFVGFMLMLVVILLSVWKMGQLLRYSCCPTVVLPDTLVRSFLYLSV